MGATRDAGRDVAAMISAMAGETARRTFLSRFLSMVERGGNALPHPATLFALLAVAVIVISAIAVQFDLTVIHPGTQKPIQPVSLLSISGLHRIMTELVTNFSGFAPLGTVLVAMLGLAVAEGSGLIGTVLRLVVISAPKRWLTFVTFASHISVLRPWNRTIDSEGDVVSATTGTEDSNPGGESTATKENPFRRSNASVRARLGRATRRALQPTRLWRLQTARARPSSSATNA